MSQNQRAKTPLAWGLEPYSLAESKKPVITSKTAVISSFGDLALRNVNIRINRTELIITRSVYYFSVVPLVDIYLCRGVETAVSGRKACDEIWCHCAYAEHSEFVKTGCDNSTARCNRHSCAVAAGDLRDVVSNVLRHQINLATIDKI